jgi:hypothetical protein
MIKTTSNFDFKLVDSFLGYNSASDKTKVRPGTLIRGSKNVYKKLWHRRFQARIEVERIYGFDRCGSEIVVRVEYVVRRGTSLTCMQQQAPSGI